MSSIYRVRPAIYKTVQEITHPYLWFSKPAFFKDSEDANVFAFVNRNEPIKAAFERLYHDNTDVAKASAEAGICCFTTELPLPSRLRRFRRANKGIVIEYDKEVLEEHFARTKGLGDCFKLVEYAENPTLFESDQSQRILWKTHGDDKEYVTMTSISRDLKLMDQLFLKTFTRISKQYEDQREYRIILAGRNIPASGATIAGYRVEIPREAIKKIHIHTLAREKVRSALLKTKYDCIDLATFRERNR